MVQWASFDPNEKAHLRDYTLYREIEKTNVN